MLSDYELSVNHDYLFTNQSNDLNESELTNLVIELLLGQSNQLFIQLSDRLVNKLINKRSDRFDLSPALTNQRLNRLSKYSSTTLTNIFNYFIDLSNDLNECRRLIDKCSEVIDYNNKNNKTIDNSHVSIVINIQASSLEILQSLDRELVNSLSDSLTLLDLYIRCNRFKSTVHSLMHSLHSLSIMTNKDTGIVMRRLYDCSTVSTISFNRLEITNYLSNDSKRQLVVSNNSDCKDSSYAMLNQMYNKLYNNAMIKLIKQSIDDNERAYRSVDSSIDKSINGLADRLTNRFYPEILEETIGPCIRYNKSIVTTDNSNNKHRKSNSLVDNCISNYLSIQTSDSKDPIDRIVYRPVDSIYRSMERTVVFKPIVNVRSNRWIHRQATSKTIRQSNEIKRIDRPTICTFATVLSTNQIFKVLLRDPLVRAHRQLSFDAIRKLVDNSAVMIARLLVVVYTPAVHPEVDMKLSKLLNDAFIWSRSSVDSLDSLRQLVIERFWKYAESADYQIDKQIDKQFDKQSNIKAVRETVSKVDMSSSETYSQAQLIVKLQASFASLIDETIRDKCIVTVTTRNKSEDFADYPALRLVDEISIDLTIRSTISVVYSNNYLQSLSELRRLIVLCMSMGWIGQSIWQRLICDRLVQPFQSMDRLTSGLYKRVIPLTMLLIKQLTNLLGDAVYSEIVIRISALLSTSVDINKSTLPMTRDAIVSLRLLLTPLFTSIYRVYSEIATATNSRVYPSSCVDALVNVQVVIDEFIASIRINTRASYHNLLAPLLEIIGIQKNK